MEDCRNYYGILPGKRISTQVARSSSQINRLNQKSKAGIWYLCVSLQSHYFRGNSELWSPIFLARSAKKWTLAAVRHLELRVGIDLLLIREKRKTCSSHKDVLFTLSSGLRSLFSFPLLLALLRGGEASFWVLQLERTSWNKMSYGE